MREVTAAARNAAPHARPSHRTDRARRHADQRLPVPFEATASATARRTDSRRHTFGARQSSRRSAESVLGTPSARYGGDGFRFAGCWSVRLTSQGFHTNHIHREGWVQFRACTSTCPTRFAALPIAQGTFSSACRRSKPVSICRRSARWNRTSVSCCCSRRICGTARCRSQPRVPASPWRSISFPSTDSHQQFIMASSLQSLLDSGSQMLRNRQFAEAQDVAAAMLAAISRQSTGTAVRGRHRRRAGRPDRRAALHRGSAARFAASRSGRASQGATAVWHCAVARTRARPRCPRRRRSVDPAQIAALAQVLTIVRTPKARASGC